MPISDPGRQNPNRSLSIVFLGPPGSGKGTQSRLLSAAYAIPHVDTGELLRGMAEEPSGTGQMIKSYLERGLLVPERIVADAIERRLAQRDCENGFVLDGFPRTISQAKLFDHMLERLGRRLTAAVLLEVPESIVMARLSRRLVCARCSTVFQGPESQLLRPSICQQCGGEIQLRPDDRPEVATRRLKLYAHETTPVIAKFRDEGILVRIDGTGNVEDVFKRIDQALRPTLGTKDT